MKDKRGVDALIHALRDNYADVREKSAEALGRMGKAAAPAAPELIGAPSDPDPLARGVATRDEGAPRRGRPARRSSAPRRSCWGCLRW